MLSEVSPAIWTAAPPKRGAMAFAALFAVESLARSLIATVVSVEAHDLLQQSQRVSVLFTCVSASAMVGALNVWRFMRTPSTCQSSVVCCQWMKTFATDN